MARWGCCPKAPTWRAWKHPHLSEWPRLCWGCGRIWSSFGRGHRSRSKGSAPPLLQLPCSPVPSQGPGPLALRLHPQAWRPLPSPAPALPCQPAGGKRQRRVGESWPGLGEGLGPSFPWPWPTPPRMLSREQLPLRWLPFLSSPHHPSSKELSHNVVFHQDW